MEDDSLDKVQVRDWVSIYDTSIDPLTMVVYLDKDVLIY